MNDRRRPRQPNNKSLGRHGTCTTRKGQKERMRKFFVGQQLKLRYVCEIRCACGAVYNYSDLPLGQCSDNGQELKQRSNLKGVCASETEQQIRIFKRSGLPVKRSSSVMVSTRL
jgi:hypothetical protein